MAKDDSQRIDELLDRLRGRRVEGPGRGGPYVGIAPDDVTRAIVAEGKPAIPRVLARLDGSGFDETVYLVFLLRELHATEAEPAIRKLQSEIPARSVGRDLTLKMQIDYFLRDVGTW